MTTKIDDFYGSILLIGLIIGLLIGASIPYLFAEPIDFSTLNRLCQEQYGNNTEFVDDILGVNSHIHCKKIISQEIEIKEERTVELIQ